MIHTLVELLDEQDPLLTLAIHNGHAMHPALLADCGISEADRLREEDPHTEVFVRFSQNYIIVNTSRFTVDLNRPRDLAVYQKPEDCWGLPVRLQPISDTLLAELLADYDGWYSLLVFTVRRLLQKHPFLLILDLHSFSHRRQGPNAPADPQSENPDIILGRNNLPVQYYPWVEKLRTELDGKFVKEHKLDCRIDVKFTGGRLSRWLNQSFPGQVLCLAVEFKKIFMDEWTGSVDKDFQIELGKLFAHAVDHCRTELIR